MYKVSRSGFYAWRKRQPSFQQIANEQLLKEIITIFQTSRGTYGSPRITAALRLRGINVNKKRVARLMRKNLIKARAAKIYTKYPGILRKFYCSIPNRQLKEKLSRLNQVWVGDITYLTAGPYLRYLAVVMDKYSRQVVGWSLGDQKGVKLTRSALAKAIRNRQPQRGLIFHSDRGMEYGNNTFQKQASKFGIIQSMNRPRRMTDNAFMESFFHSLKSDCYHSKRFSTEAELKRTIANYIAFYNNDRLHSALGYISPVQFERRL